MKKRNTILILIALVLLSGLLLIYSRPTPRPTPEPTPPALPTLPIDPAHRQDNIPNFELRAGLPTNIPQQLKHQSLDQALDRSQAERIASTFGSTEAPIISDIGSDIIYRWYFSGSRLLTINSNPPYLFYHSGLDTPTTAPPGISEARDALNQFLSEHSLPGISGDPISQKYYLIDGETQLERNGPLSANLLEITFSSSLNGYPLRQSSYIKSSASARFSTGPTVFSLTYYFPPQTDSGQDFPTISPQLAFSRLQDGQGTIVGAGSPDEMILPENITQVTITSIALEYSYFPTDQEFRPVYTFNGEARDNRQNFFLVTYLVPATIYP